MLTKFVVKNRWLCVLLASGTLYACGGSSGGGGEGEIDGIVPSPLENPVRIASLGVVPASDNTTSSYLLQLTNYSEEKYTLQSARVIDIGSGKDSALISIASQACNFISANGSCSLQLTPHTLKSRDIKLEIKIKSAQGTVHILNQLIRISSKLNVTQGGGIAMINDVERIISEDGNYSLSLPVILGDDYDDIKASNGTLFCNAAGYVKGNNCTYQVNGKVSGSKTIVATRLEGIKSGKIVAVQEGNTRIEIGKGANLLLSHGTTINYPESSNEITVFNSGNTDATNLISSTLDSNLTIGTAAVNSCETKLSGGDTCKIRVDVNGTINGQGVVQVAYQDGSIDYKVASNVEYTVANAVAGIEFREIGTNNLLNALVGGKTRSAEIEVKNAGNRALNQLNYYLAPVSNEFIIEAGSSNACGLNGAHILNAGASCQVKVKYKATSVTASSVINLMVNGEYVDHNGQTHSLVQGHGLNYSAEKAGSLSWVQRSGPTNLIIQSNNIDSKSAIWDLKNTIADDEGLSAMVNGVDLNPNITPDLGIEAESIGICGSGSSIAGNAYCGYRVIYGPTPTVQSARNITLRANYALGGESKITDSSSFQIQAVASAITSVSASVEVKTEPSGLDGSGITTDPYSFVALTNNQLELTYSFKNNGTESALVFNVDSGNLPVGSSITGGDCPTGIDTTTLAAGDSCTITVSVPNPNLFKDPNLSDSSLNGAKLDLSLPYSYYKGNNIVYESRPDTRIYVQFNRLWGIVSQAIESYTETDTEYIFDIKTTINVSNDTPGVTKPITVRPYLVNPVSGVTLGSCTINDGLDSCIDKISLPKNMFAPGAKLNLSSKVKAAGMESGDALIHNFSIQIGTKSSRYMIYVTESAFMGNMRPIGEYTGESGIAKADKICNTDRNKPTGSNKYKAHLRGREVTDTVYHLGATYYTIHAPDGRNIIIENATDEQFGLKETDSLLNPLVATENEGFLYFPWEIRHIFVGAKGDDSATCNNWTEASAMGGCILHILHMIQK